MENNTLVLVLDPEDPQLAGIRQTSKPIFGIVLEVMDYLGISLNFRCKVKHDAGVSSVLRAGRLAPLLVLPEEDVALSPREAFSKHAATIVEKQAWDSLRPPQCGFLRLKGPDPI